jgi:hypothetical protein
MIEVDGAGDSLDLPSPLAISGPLVVQLANDAEPSRCWESVYVASTRSDANVYRASE